MTDMCPWFIVQWVLEVGWVYFPPRFIFPSRKKISTLDFLYCFNNLPQKRLSGLSNKEFRMGHWHCLTLVELLKLESIGLQKTSVQIYSAGWYKRHFQCMQKLMAVHLWQLVSTIQYINSVVNYYHGHLLIYLSHVLYFTLFSFIKSVIKLAF